MADNVIHIRPPEQETLHLLGIHLDPSRPEPELYTLFAMGGSDDRPLTANERILLFTDPARAADALELAGHDMKRLGPPPVEMELVCDVAEALYFVHTQESDEEGVIFSCLNVLDDLVRAARLNLPADYMALLSRLAEHLAEHNEFGTFLREQGMDRERIEDAILWCVGAVAVKATVIE